jgi:hypothetical protein
MKTIHLVRPELQAFIRDNPIPVMTAERLVMIREAPSFPYPSPPEALVTVEERMIAEPDLYHIPMILTHEDGFWRFSARSARRGDVVHRPERATPSEGRQKPPPVAISRPLDFVAASPR